jgi:phage repressor protein C with HTH and peptisase S24 domain
MNERIESFQNRLRKAMRFRDIKGADLARKTKFSEANISQWVNGVYEAKQEGVFRLATALNVNEAWLMGYDVPMEKTISADTYAKWDEEHFPNRKPNRQEQIAKTLKQIRVFNSPVSAGTGAWLDDGHEYEYFYLLDVPSSADFALRVRGDSMEPMYSDDDIVFVKSNVIVESGQIGVFCLNDEGYLKQLQGNRLISLNNKYDPVTIHEWDSFFCAGRVIGKTHL